MKIIIKKDELMELEHFMWDKYDTRALPTPTDTMVGKEYGEAICHKRYSSGGWEYIDYSLYLVQTDYYGPIYIMTTHTDEGKSDIKILPIDITTHIEIEIED